MKIFLSCVVMLSALGCSAYAEPVDADNEEIVETSESVAAGPCATCFHRCADGSLQRGGGATFDAAWQDLSCADHGGMGTGSINCVWNGCFVWLEEPPQN